MTSYKCRPARLKSRITCETQPSLTLSCPQQTKIIIANARFTKQSRILSFCGPRYEQALDALALQKERDKGKEHSKILLFIQKFLLSLNLFSYHIDPGVGCDDLEVTDEVSEACTGEQTCSYLAHPTKLTRSGLNKYHSHTNTATQ